MATLTAERVREVLNYDSNTGVFVWAKSLSNRRGIGNRAGVRCRRDGYRIIGIDGKTYVTSRLAWLWMTGEWPKFVDHINCNRDDDRWSNLREASRTENQCNRGRQSNNRSGFKGVHAHQGRWRARICKEQKSVSLGVYDTPEEAHQAYIVAAEKIHGAFARAK